MSLSFLYQEQLLVRKHYTLYVIIALCDVITCLTSVPANVDWRERAVELEFQAGRSVEECGCIGILDDTISEDTERFVIELRSSDPTIIIVAPAQVIVDIEDDDDDGGKIEQGMRIYMYIEGICIIHTCR